MKLFAALALIAVPVALAQTPPASEPQTPTPTLSANSTLVLVPALVRNKAGELVSPSPRMTSPSPTTASRRN